MTNALITALVGLVGIAIGAWLNSLLTTRREKWHLKRELYTRLLQSLGDAKFYLGMAKERHDREAMKKFMQSADEIRRVRSVAAIMLSNEASTVLDQFAADWSSADENEAMLRTSEFVDKKISVLKNAYDLVVAAARCDLG